MTLAETSQLRQLKTTKQKEKNMFNPCSQIKHKTDMFRNEQYQQKGFLETERWHRVCISGEF